MSRHADDLEVEFQDRPRSHHRREAEQRDPDETGIGQICPQTEALADRCKSDADRVQHLRCEIDAHVYRHNAGCVIGRQRCGDRLPGAGREIRRETECDLSRTELDPAVLQIHRIEIVELRMVQCQVGPVTDHAMVVKQNPDDRARFELGNRSPQSDAQIARRIDIEAQFEILRHRCRVDTDGCQQFRRIRQTEARRNDTEVGTRLDGHDDVGSGRRIELILHGDAISGTDPSQGTDDQDRGHEPN